MIFSHSVMNDARKCLRLYQLKHVERVSVPQSLSGDMEFGTAIHLGLNDLLSGGDGVTIFNSYWDTLKDKTDVQYTRYRWDSLKTQGETLLNKFERLHRKHFVPTRMDERLGVDVQGVRIEGTPDFVGIYKGDPVILDFKTSGSNYAKEKIDCEEQLSLYAELEHRTNGTKLTRKVYYVFKKDYADPSIQVLSAELKPSNRTAVWDSAVSFCKDLSTRTEFHKNPSSCVMGTFKCPYFEKCWR